MTKTITQHFVGSADTQASVQKCKRNERGDMHSFR